VIDVLPRLFPSLYTETTYGDESATVLKYNKQNDHGRFKIYHDIIKDLNEKYNDNRLDADWDVFPVLLAGTITTLEIEQRGVGGGNGTELWPPVLGLLSSQDLMLLRVLSETVRTMMVFRDAPERHSMWLKLFRKHLERMYQLLPPQESNNNGDFQLTPLLYTDVFERFVIACGLSSHAFDIGTGQLLLFYYFAEVSKICMAVLESPSFTDLLHEDPTLFSDTDDIPIGPRHLLKHFVDIFMMYNKFVERLWIGTYRMLQRFILPFLRKAVIFTHVYEGVIFTQVDSTQDEPESDRLCRLLGLPTVAEVLDMDLTTTAPLSLLVQNWTEERYTNHVNPVYNLHHPAIFEPIGLPKRLDVLLELASKYRCRKCHLVPDDPAMCLLCGKVVCAQSICCSSDTYGEMNIHREEYKSHMCD
jgi:E3 ubiquitin-protein ligase UBR1